MRLPKFRWYYLPTYAVVVFAAAILVVALLLRTSCGSWYPGLHLCGGLEGSVANWLVHPVIWAWILVTYLLPVHQVFGLTQGSGFMGPNATAIGVMLDVVSSGLLIIGLNAAFVVVIKGLRRRENEWIGYYHLLLASAILVTLGVAYGIGTEWGALFPRKSWM